MKSGRSREFFFSSELNPSDIQLLFDEKRVAVEHDFESTRESLEKIFQKETIDQDDQEKLIRVLDAHWKRMQLFENQIQLDGNNKKFMYRDLLSQLLNPQIKKALINNDIALAVLMARYTFRSECLMLTKALSWNKIMHKMFELGNQFPEEDRNKLFEFLKPNKPSLKHQYQLHKIGKEIWKILEECQWQIPSYQVVFNVTGNPYSPEGKLYYYISEIRGEDFIIQFSGPSKDKSVVTIAHIYANQYKINFWDNSTIIYSFAPVDMAVESREKSWKEKIAKDTVNISIDFNGCSIRHENDNAGQDKMENVAAYLQGIVLPKLYAKHISAPNKAETLEQLELVSSFYLRKC